MADMPPERQSRARCRPEPQTTVYTEPAYSSGSTDNTDSKAERIARYKAERRRQLAERYGISLDHEPDADPASRYTRGRKESDASEKHGRSGDEGSDFTSSYTTNSTRGGRTAAPQEAQGDPGHGRSRVDSFTERERMMNLENQRRAQERSIPEPSSSSYMDVTSSTTSSASARVPAKDYTITGVPPSSPKTSRRPSLPSPKHGVSPGDVFIEQQAHNILSRQG